MTDWVTSLKEELNIILLNWYFSPSDSGYFCKFISETPETLRYTFVLYKSWQSLLLYIRKVHAYSFKQSLLDVAFDYCGHTFCVKHHVPLGLKKPLFLKDSHTLTQKAIQNIVQNVLSPTTSDPSDWNTFGCVSTPFCRFKGLLPCSEEVRIPCSRNQKGR